MVKKKIHICERERERECAVHNIQPEFKKY